MIGRYIDRYRPAPSASLEPDLNIPRSKPTDEDPCEPYHYCFRYIEGGPGNCQKAKESMCNYRHEMCNLRHARRYMPWLETFPPLWYISKQLSDANSVPMGGHCASTAASEIPKEASTTKPTNIISPVQGPTPRATPGTMFSAGSGADLLDSMAGFLADQERTTGYAGHERSSESSEQACRNANLQPVHTPKPAAKVSHTGNALGDPPRRRMGRRLQQKAAAKPRAELHPGGPDFDSDSTQPELKDPLEWSDRLLKKLGLIAKKTPDDYPTAHEWMLRASSRQGRQGNIHIAHDEMKALHKVLDEALGIGEELDRAPSVGAEEEEHERRGSRKRRSTARHSSLERWGCDGEEDCDDEEDMGLSTGVQWSKRSSRKWRSTRFRGDAEEYGCAEEDCDDDEEVYCPAPPYRGAAAAGCSPHGHVKLEAPGPAIKLEHMPTTTANAGQPRSSQPCPPLAAVDSSLPKSEEELAMEFELSAARFEVSHKEAETCQRKAEMLEKKQAMEKARRQRPLGSNPGAAIMIADKD